MAIEQQQAIIRCDFCEATYTADRAVLKPGWQHVVINGVKGLVSCPREIVEQTVVIPSTTEAQERFYDNALLMAAREGKSIT